MEEALLKRPNDCFFSLYFRHASTAPTINQDCLTDCLRDVGQKKGNVATAIQYDRKCQISDRSTSCMLSPVAHYGFSAST